MFDVSQITMNWGGFHSLSHLWLASLLVPLVLFYFLKFHLRPRFKSWQDEANGLIGNVEIHRVSKSPHCPNEGEIRLRDDAQKQLIDFGRPNLSHQP